MRVGRLLTIVALAVSVGVMAQEKFTLEDLNFGGVNYKQFVPETKDLVWEGKQLVERSKDDAQKDKEEQAKKLPHAEVREGQLVVLTKDGLEHQLTDDGTVGGDIVYGEAVHRNEWGIDGGLFWSPKENKLAFYRMDQSMVPNYYPMAGEKSHVVSVGVYDTQRDTLVYLHTADPVDRFFTNIAWSPDEEKIYMMELDRAQNHEWLVAYDSRSGELLDTLYEERADKYVEPMTPIVFLPWDDGKFILESEKDGWNHLYLFDVSGRELKQLTKGDWVVLEMVGFDQKDKAIVYLSNELSTMQRNIFKVDVKTGRRTCLDNGEGWHSAMLNDDGSMLVDNYSAPTVPRQIDVTDTHTGKRTSYFTASDPWEGYDQPLFRAGQLVAADGRTELNYRMVLPKDFDETEKYPTVVYVYGGPHAHMVDASWHYLSRSWETYMAQKGFIVFVLDNRGSENRGREFEQVTWHELGVEEMKDQMVGVDFLKSLPYVDADRLGVHGWSYGGYMTISLMTTYPGVFKVGVAGGPVIDWKWYEVMYGERYMGTPESNPEGYAKCSLLGKAKDLRGRLEIIIGKDDDVVVPLHAYSFLEKCIEEGVQVDFFVYPGEGHNMRGHKSVHLHERITQYFEDFL